MKEPDNSTPHRASDYDRQVRQTIPLYDLFYDQVLDLVAAAKPCPELWLDTGCGTGSLVALAARRFSSARFLLSDPSAEMLDSARNKLESQGNIRFEFLQPCATQDLPLDQGLKPEVITAIQAHHYLAPELRRRATKRCFDLLPAGGLYISFENCRPATESGTVIALDRMYGYQVETGKSREDAAAHRLRYDREYFPITVEEHLQLYRECGFAVVELLWYSYFQAGFYCLKAGECNPGAAGNV